MKKQGLFLPLMLASTLAIGFATVWGVLGVWAVQLGMHVAGSERYSESLCFLKDGTPRICADGGEERQYFDLDHKPAPPQDANPRMDWGANLAAAMPVQTETEQASWFHRIRAFTDANSPAVYWYFQSDGQPNGKAYFVGFDSKNNTRVGFLGLAGFRADPLAADEMIPFGGNLSGQQSRVLNVNNHFGPNHPRMYEAPTMAAHMHHAPGVTPAAASLAAWDTYVFGNDGKLYHADLRTRTIRTVLEGSTIRSVALAVCNNDRFGFTPVIRTEDAVLVLGENDQVKTRFTIPDSLRGGDLTFVATANGQAVMYRHSRQDSVATEVNYLICWVSAEGNTREATITLPWVSGDADETIVLGAVVPSPALVFASIAIMRVKELMNIGMAATYGEAFAQALEEYRPAIGIAHLFAIVLAGLCYRRQVRYGASRLDRVVWPMFVFVLGLPGWIGYRFGRSWPVLDRCPTCNTFVPRDCPECIRCAANFPGPVQKGTEVFA